MKVLLTGITGNLGYEVYRDLIGRGIEVVPSLRAGKTDFLSLRGIQSDRLLVCDLAGDDIMDFSYKVDCIVHCAGDVQFKNAEMNNERMMVRIVELARKISVPIYFASTAFLYKPNQTSGFNNNYELDKFNAEQVLIESNIPHTIFRPSILVGNSKNGGIINFSGYYGIVKAFLIATKKSLERNSPFRFPKMTGKSNLLPVDQAAKRMGDIIAGKRLGQTLYLVNPEPPASDWVMDETLKFFGMRKNIHELEISFDAFAKLDLTEEEQIFLKYATHFLPYWSLRYDFPESICKSNLVDHNYLIKALTYFTNKNQIKP